MLLASLWWLSEHGERPPTQAQLAEQAGTDQMMTSQVLRRLEQSGLVERTVDPQDTRARRLRLTPAGEEVLARTLGDVETADEHYFAALGGRRVQFARSLALLDNAHTAPERRNPGQTR